ncbi:MAG: hypothetical protein AB7E45_07910 [Candidatus Caldatribacteriota bacterium]
MEQITLEVLNERLIALKEQDTIIHSQLAESIKEVSNQLLEERRRTNGSLEKIHQEIKELREKEIKDLRLGMEDLRVKMEVKSAKNPSWKNSYIITFLTTLSGILLTYTIARSF